MKSYRFIIRFAGYEAKHNVQGNNDDEAGENFINELKSGQVNWDVESLCNPNKMFITYEELNGA